MTQMVSAAGKEQRLLRNARRESLVVMAAWLAALVWSVGCGTIFGYNRPAGEVGPGLNQHPCADHGIEIDHRPVTHHRRGADHGTLPDTLANRMSGITTSRALGMRRSY